MGATVDPSECPNACFPTALTPTPVLLRLHADVATTSVALNIAAYFFAVAFFAVAFFAVAFFAGTFFAGAFLGVQPLKDSALSR